ncbi:hypothetical protein [Evansella tamaricis]|uniref:Uncharacterized protein n=1 Tax=Evansella tamaricis TaxID=2069301 RepID=A0ABS6JC52_9BACI|nr:hypothetical protein [Evansella tamaricis]MBU9711078.1 hypothetical protein [Evansella tamaricis]
MNRCCCHSEKMERAAELWEELMGLVEEVTEVVLNDINFKKEWHVPRNLIMKSQVIDRKPKYICARNRL